MWRLLRSQECHSFWPVFRTSHARISSSLNDMHTFSKVDLIRGYHKVPVVSEDVPKTAIIAPFEIFEFLQIPFGLKMQSKPSNVSWTLSASDWSSLTST